MVALTRPGRRLRGLRFYRKGHCLRVLLFRRQSPFPGASVLPPVPPTLKPRLRHVGGPDAPSDRVVGLPRQRPRVSAFLKTRVEMRHSVQAVNSQAEDTLAVGGASGRLHSGTFTTAIKYTAAHAAYRLPRSHYRRIYRLHHHQLFRCQSQS